MTQRIGNPGSLRGEFMRDRKHDRVGFLFLIDLVLQWLSYGKLSKVDRKLSQEFEIIMIIETRELELSFIGSPVKSQM